MKKLGKVLGILGGLFVFSEVWSIMGQVQNMAAMHETHPDAVDESIDIMLDDTIGSDLNWFVRNKCKLIGKLSRFYIDEDVLGFLVGR